MLQLLLVIFPARASAQRSGLLHVPDKSACTRNCGQTNPASGKFPARCPRRLPAQLLCFVHLLRIARGYLDQVFCK